MFFSAFVVVAGFCLLPSSSAAPGYGPPSYGDHTFYQGHDLSSLLILEEGGAIYKDTARRNKTRPAEDILIDGGMNTARLR
jgi:arabinogalactan endo-1,4-beta-galactosidase